MNPTIDVQAALNAHFGDAVSTSVDPWDQSAFPVVRPTSRSMLAEVLAFARGQGLRLLPLGRGTKLGRRLPPKRLDFGIDMGAFDRLLAFEPGDGTITAEAGISIDALASICHKGARRVVPELAPGASLGGAIATAETGGDRLWRGPIREHVLGLQVMLSNGSLSRSGGRLVKNVAGYDLHRLHTGAWGGLGVILEATLRLFPTPECERYFRVAVTGLDQAIELTQSLAKHRLPVKRIWSQTKSGRTQLFIALAGRRDVLDFAFQQTLKRLPNLESMPGPIGRARPSVLLHARPSCAKKLGQHSSAILAALPAGSRLDFDPLLAQSGFTTVGLSSFDLAKLLAGFIPAATGDDIHFALPNLPSTKAPDVLALTKAIERALDPTESFARE